VAAVVLANVAGAELPARIVSLNPSLTAILLALGEGERLVGVDDYSARQIGEVAALPRVGGLFNPSLEAVVALEPDLVVLVPSAEQRAFRERVEALGVGVEAFDNHAFDEVLENIERLGALTGARDAAAVRVAAIKHARGRVERAVAKLQSDGEAGGAANPREGHAAKPPTIAMVLQRDPLFVVGGGNFIDTMLTIVGVRNVAAEYSESYPRVSLEWLVARSPALLVDLSPEANDPRDTLAFWKQWPHIAAVENDRLIALDAALISMPGPALDASLLLLARTLWGEAIEGHLAVDAGRTAKSNAPGRLH
jgi:iron complex transport system substrate-binding protein